MKSIQELADGNNEVQISESAMYDDIISKLNEAKENGTPIDEGLFGAIFGGLTGATVGPAVMKGVAKVLGIDERGALYNLMTSRLILTGLGTYLGWKQ